MRSIDELADEAVLLASAGHEEFEVTATEQAALRSLHPQDWDAAVYSAYVRAGRRVERGKSLRIVPREAEG